MTQENQSLVPKPCGEILVRDLVFALPLRELCFLEALLDLSTDDMKNEALKYANMRASGLVPHHTSIEYDDKLKKPVVYESIDKTNYVVLMKKDE